MKKRFKPRGSRPFYNLGTVNQKILAIRKGMAEVKKLLNTGSMKS